jgi:4-cresol dehydrogenase (hydroxylating)
VLKHWVKWRTGMNLDVCLDRFLVSTRLCGVVKVKGLKGAYWRMRTPPPTEEVDLDKDRVGFVWVDPVIPLEGQRVKQAMDIIDQTQTEHGFDFNVGLNCVTERSIFVTGAFVYDRNVEGMDDRVMKAAHALVKNLDESGFPVGRATIATMEEVMSRTDPNLRAMQAKIKKALDPNGILSPGRYELQ